jgi:hypothetical protein
VVESDLARPLARPHGSGEVLGEVLEGRGVRVAGTAAPEPVEDPIEVVLKSTMRGRPPNLGGGSRGAKMAHSRSLRSEG